MDVRADIGNGGAVDWGLITPQLPGISPLWVGATFLAIDSQNDNKEYRVAFGRVDIYDRNELEELFLWQRERLTKEILADRAKGQPKLTKGQQHDLGKTLLEIRDSKIFRRDNGHGRYW